MFGGASKILTVTAATVGMFATVASVASSMPLTSVSAAPYSSANQMSPIVALSVFGSEASVTALCGSAIAASTSAQAPPAIEPTIPVAVQPPVGGCVLPVVDTPPVALSTGAPPPGVAPLGIGPLLVALAGIGGASAAVANQGSANPNRPPISVN